MATVPASAFVNVVPGVLAAAGTALSLSGLFLTTNTRVPVGQVLSFPSALSVSSYFGPSSAEYTASQIYFNGFTISTVKPANLLFTQYNTSAVAAYLRGGSVASLTLAQLQAISGSLTVVLDGFSRTGGSINLSSATSFSSAAALIQTGLNGGISQLASVTGSLTGTTLTVSAVLSGSISLGLAVTGGGTGVQAGTYVVSQISGTVNGTGTYLVSAAGSMGVQTVGLQPANAAVTYDSVSGALVVTSGVVGAISTAAYATGTIASSLMLTQGSGAVLSQGSAAATPAAFMTGVVATFQNFASFKTLFDPDGGSGNAQKLAFATWNGLQGSRYVYVCADTDVTPTLSTQATASLGYLLAQSGIGGTCLIYEPAGTSLGSANFVSGCIASLNFSQKNGRTTFAYLTQSGLGAGVTSQTALANLQANGYNCVVAVATASQTFVYFYPGSVSGPFTWLDTYVNQIWLNSGFQGALMTLLTGIGSIPYNTAGNALIESALSGVIQQGLAYGVFRAGVTLSATQVASVNNAAGNTTAATTLANRGWYLQIGTAPPAVRQARGSPPMTFWYMDGESVQTMNLASIVLL